MSFLGGFCKAYVQLITMLGYNINLGEVLVIKIELESFNMLLLHDVYKIFLIYYFFHLFFCKGHLLYQYIIFEFQSGHSLKLVFDQVAERIQRDRFIIFVHANDQNVSIVFEDKVELML